MKVLFLYTELAEYFIACLRHLASRGVEIKVVRWKLNQEAPFRFSLPSEIEFINRDEVSDQRLLEIASGFKPDVVYVSGWLDKGYVKVAQLLKAKGTTVIGGLDNHWTGSFKQQVMRLLSPFTVKRYFDYVWVPGRPQMEYVRKLGFSSNRILTGFYSADVPFFSAIYSESFPKKEKKFPHRFIFTGRYVPYKWVNELCLAFLKVTERLQSDWELFCAGTGPLYDERIHHEKIHHLGFVQPAEMRKVMETTGVFVLPGTFEPWGVVVHEFAAAGFPLICSSRIGAATELLLDRQNGFLFQAGDITALETALESVIKMSDQKLLEMGRLSHETAKKISPDSWSSTIISVIEKEKGSHIH